MKLTHMAIRSIVVSVSAAVGLSATAAPIFLDFSLESSSSADGTTSTYNNIDDSDASPIALNDSDGFATGITIQKPDIGGSGPFNGTAGPITGDAAAAGITLDAASSYHFSSNNGQVVTYTFAGLDDTTAYDFTIFGARAQTDPRPTEYTLSNGTASTSAVLDVTTPTGANNSEVVVLGGINPVGGGLTLSFTSDPNATGVSNAYGYINAARISVVPEPAMLTLAGLGGLTLIRHRPTRDD